MLMANKKKSNLYKKAVKADKKIGMILKGTKKIK